jgi:TadE-like protein
MAAILLLTVVFGVMTLCYALYCYNVVSEAAREGTRFAIVRGYTCTGFPSACPAATDGTDTQTYVKYLGFPGINPSNMAVSSVYTSTNGVACSPSTACNNPGNQVKVTVTYKLPFVLPFKFAETLSVSNSAEMVISQ